MKKAQIIHNPTAGDGRHDKTFLISAVQRAGYEVHYINTKHKAWEAAYLKDSAIVFIAGGDGTVQKVAATLLKRSSKERQIPLQILPLGTANNIAKALDVFDLPFDQLVQIEKQMSFDCGQVTGIKNHCFFIESMGLGVFPELILKMKNESEKNRSPSEELKHTYTILKDIIATYKPRETTLSIDDKIITGSFLMAEIMNINLLGPNIELAPDASASDAIFDLVLIHEKFREDLILYVESLSQGTPDIKKLKQIVQIYPAKKISFINVTSKLHVDDDLIQDHVEKVVTAEVYPAAFTMRYNAE